MNGKVSVVFKRNCFPKMKDILRLGPLQAVTLIKIVVSEKLCKIDTLLLHTTTHTRLKSGTTRVSQYQKGKSNLDFTEARDSEWHWHQLGHMQVCTSPNQQCQSTEGSTNNTHY